MAYKENCIFWGTLIFSIAIFFSIQLISAIDTPITITSLDPDNNYIFRVQDHYSNETLERVEVQSDSEGIYDQTFESNESLKRLSFALMEIENKKIVETKYFYGEYFTGNAVSLDFKEKIKVENTSTASSTATTQTNTTINETTTNTTTNTTSETTSTNSAITGKAIIDYKEVFSKSKYYIFGAIAFLILGLMAFMIIKKRKAKDSNPYSSEKFTYKKLDTKINQAETDSFLSKITRSTSSSVSPASSGKIDEAERKIKELQNEINKMKNEQIIKEAERKLEQDKQDLEKLRRSTGFYK